MSNNTKVVIIYDQNDLVEQGGSIHTHVNQLIKEIGEEYVHKNIIVTSKDVLKSEISTIELNSGAKIIHAHESLWDFDFDHSEFMYGVSKNTKNIVFVSDLQTLKNKVLKVLRNF